MKKRGYFLSVILIVMIGIMAFKPTVKEHQNEWTEWKQTNCLKGIDFRVKKGKYEMSRRARKWEFQFKNRYNANVYFNFKAISSTQMSKFKSARTSRSRVQISGNSTTKVLSSFIKANNELYVDIVKIRFGKEDIGKNYYKCDQ